MRCFGILVAFWLTLGMMAGDADDALVDAALQQADGRYGQAMAVYRSILGRKGAQAEICAEAMYQLGRCQLKSGQLEKANKTFIQVLREYPKVTQVHFQLLRDLDRARRILKLRVEAMEPGIDGIGRNASTRAVWKRLSTIMLDNVAYKDVLLSKVLQDLQVRSRRIDRERKGVVIQLRLKPFREPKEKKAGAGEAMWEDDDDDDNADVEEANKKDDEIGRAHV